MTWHAKGYMFVASSSSASIINIVSVKVKAYIPCHITQTICMLKQSDDNESEKERRGERMESLITFSEKRLTRTKVQKRSINACRISEFWWGCKILRQVTKDIM